MKKMNINKAMTLTEIKNIIKPSFYWERKRLSRKLYFFKQEIIKELSENKLIKYLLKK
jgi:Mn-dependent DtxR family transcriptional regulator